MIIEGVTVHAFDSKNWVVHTPQGRNFLVNQATYQLFQILRGCSNLANALEQFNNQFSANLSEQQFGGLIAEKLGGYHILTEDESAEKPTLKNQYLKLKFEIINPRWAGILSKPLQIFYGTAVFWWALAALIIFITSVFLSTSIQISFTSNHLYLYSSLIYIAMCVHELGHIAACQRYKLEHGGIGFGFYFLLPVMYADITNVWLIDKEKRIITNLGGIFSEALYVSLLVLIYLLTDLAVFLAAGLSISIFTVWELNPFVRFDGYWILSDLTNTPNLVAKSKSMLQKVYQDIVKNSNNVSYSKKEIWIFIYGIINTGVFLCFMTYTIFVFRYDIIRFPNTIWVIINHILQGNFEYSKFNRQFLLILTFYVLIIRFLYTNIQNLVPIWLKWVAKFGLSNKTQ